MATLKEQQKILREIAKIEEKIQTQSRINRSTREEYNALLKESAAISKNQIESNKIQESISNQVLKAQQDIVKSNESYLGLLLKGNIQGVLQKRNLGSALGAQLKLLEATEETADKPADLVTDGKISIEDRNQLSKIQKGILDGSVKESNLAEELNGLSEQGLAYRSKFENSAKLLLGLFDKRNKAEKESNNLNEKLNARFAKGAAVFAVIAMTAEKFAGLIDAIGESFGSLVDISGKVTNNLLKSNVQATALGASITDVVAATNTLSGEFGISLSEASELSGQVIDISKAIGLSVDETANLIGTLMTTSGLSFDQAESLAEGARQLAVAADVAPSAVMKDLAGSSETFAKFSKDGGDNLARAAVQARALGISLDTTANIASGLLDFESSITKEVEASVLIGRQLNLQKAREAALANDLVGVNKAIVEQLGSQSEFNQLNSLQRQALAEALNTDVANLAKMVSNTDDLNAVAGKSAQSFRDLLGAEGLSNLTQLTNSLKSLAVTLVTVFGPILELLVGGVNALLSPVAGIVNAISMDDGVIGKGGVSVMAGPAGVFKLNPRDSVLATTNPIPVNDMVSNPAPPPVTNVRPEAEKQTIVLSARVRGRDLVFLGDRPNAGGDAGYEGLA